jgi:hypothetical protein
MVRILLKFNLEVLVNLLILHKILGITENLKMKILDQNFIKQHKIGIKI